MRKPDSDRHTAVSRVRELPAFCGLGLGVDAALFHAARIALASDRTRRVMAVPPAVCDPVRPWGFELLLTLNRQTRAG